MPNTPTHVRSGLDCLLADRLDLLRDRRTGLLCNPTAVTADLRHAIDCLAAAPGVRLRRMLGPPQRRGGAPHGMIAGAGEVDSATGLEVVSLYGSSASSLAPPRGSLADLDVLVYDIQDIGTRFYTFAATLAHCMEAACSANVQVVVCDRPNPIGGDAVEGPRLQAGYESFVGTLPVPIRHGMSVGELASLWARHRGLDLDLVVGRAAGGRRSAHFGQTGLPWVMPSPYMPTPATALVYPGMCLVEGTELSEGRGTTRPFELAGHPDLDPLRFAAELMDLNLPGVALRACSFLPTFQKHAGTVCHGVQLHVTDPRAFRSVLTGVAFLCVARRLLGDGFQWRARPYEFVGDIPAIDLLGGGPELREGVEAGADPFELAAAWVADERSFLVEREPSLLY